MYQRLVVPLDGSDMAERALIEAETMAALTQAPLHLVRVIDFTAADAAAAYGVLADPSTISTLLADEVESARQYLDAVARRTAERGLRASHELRRGRVATELLAASKPGDLYVMASHGRSGIARWFMGSVAEEVVRRASVPVLLVKVSAYTGLRQSTQHPPAAALLATS